MRCLKVKMVLAGFSNVVLHKFTLTLVDLDLYSSLAIRSSEGNLRLFGRDCYFLWLYLGMHHINVLRYCGRGGTVNSKLHMNDHDLLGEVKHA